MMRIAIRGEGPPLVMIHGWAMHSGLFGALLDRLGAHRTLHLVDLPGHGRSRDDGSRLELDACVEAIAAATPRAPWLGWSLGGLFALHAAATQSVGVEALVMLCSTPRFVHATDWPHGMDVDVFRRFEAGLQDDVHATVERFLALETLGCDQAKANLRALRSEAFAHGDPAPAALADGLHLLENCDLRPALPALRVPSLWIGARRDRLVDPRAVVAAAALAPAARVVQLDSGHAPFLTHADALTDAILAFLSEAEAGVGTGSPSRAHPREVAEAPLPSGIAGSSVRGKPAEGSIRGGTIEP